MLKCSLRINDTEFSKAKIARGFFSNLKGWMFKNNIDTSDALILEKTSSIHTFNMFKSIDIIFVDKNFTVLKTVGNVKPNKALIGPKGTVATIELMAGTLERLGTIEKIVVKEE